MYNLKSEPLINKLCIIELYAQIVLNQTKTCCNWQMYSNILFSKISVSIISELVSVLKIGHTVCFKSSSAFHNTDWNRGSMFIHKMGRSFAFIIHVSVFTCIYCYYCCYKHEYIFIQKILLKKSNKTKYSTWEGIFCFWFVHFSQNCRQVYGLQLVEGILRETYKYGFRSYWTNIWKDYCSTS